MPCAVSNKTSPHCKVGSASSSIFCELAKRSSEDSNGRLLIRMHANAAQLPGLEFVERDLDQAFDRFGIQRQLAMQYAPRDRDRQA